MFKKMSSVFGVAALAVSLGFVSNAQATPVNGTGLVTPDVIFGSGNANGSWTGENVNGIEVGLRGKLRYDLNQLPQNIFNYDEDRTYTFDPASGNPPSNRSIFNFEYSVNVDSNGATGNVLSDFTYDFSFDTDPTAAMSFTTFDIITLKTDNELGTNATLNGGGLVDTVNYATLLGSNSVAQNSLNRGFGFSGILDPAVNGIFTYNLLVRDGNGFALASSSIDIIVGAPAVVPLPAALPLFGTGLAFMGFVGWRRRKVVTA